MLVDGEQSNPSLTMLKKIHLREIENAQCSRKYIIFPHWVRENVYEETEDQGQSVISVRWVITPKLVDGSWIVKARLVARGFEEDSTQFRTDSPTCMRESLRLTLCLAASKGWTINSIDYKVAFLQGKAIEREVFLHPPKEAKIDGKLWRLKKVVYGLSDASRVWYLRVVEELRRLGAVVSKLDKSLFTWKLNGDIHGLIIIHVNDFLRTGSSSFDSKVIQPLKTVFKISKECNSSFKYASINIE